jgi:hypothetical protein
MPFEPQAPFPKSRGDTIRSGDWNDLISEVQRLDTAKVERAGDTIGGSLTVAGTLGVGVKALPQIPLAVNTGAPDDAPILSLGTLNNEDFLSLFGGRRGNQLPFIAWKRGDLCFLTATDVNGQGAAEKMRITNAGNVGIGTGSPYAMLTVSGSIGFTNGTTPMLYINQTPTSNERPVLAHSPSFTNWGLAYRDTDDTFIFRGAGVTVLSVGLGNRNVGIGTDQPGFKLDITDRIRLRQGPNGTAGLWLFQSGTNTDRAFIGMASDNHVGFWGNGGVGWALQMDVNDGTVFVGANKSGSFVRFNDDLWFFDPQNGTIQTRNGPQNNFGTMIGFFQPPSSRAFKKEIRVVQEADLERLLADTLHTDLVHFRYRNDDTSQRLHLGVIAEDAPETIVGTDGQSLATSEYIAMLHGAIKALASKFVGLRTANAHLQASGRLLEARLQDLERQLSGGEVR